MLLSENTESERPDRFYVDKNARDNTNSAIFLKSTLCRTQNLSGLWPNFELLMPLSAAIAHSGLRKRSNFP
jgi:hypothetical protein